MRRGEVPEMRWRWCDEHLAAHGPDTPIYNGCNLSDEEFDSREDAEAFGLSVASDE
jgi:hypothetical protein